MRSRDLGMVNSLPKPQGAFSISTPNGEYDYEKECDFYEYQERNVNQIARRVNSGGAVYPDEADEITAKLRAVEGLFGNILEQLSKIK